MPDVPTPVSLGQPNRSLIAFHWEGDQGLTDVSASWLEADRIHPKPNICLPIQNWQNTPEAPDQWDIKQWDADTVRLTLRQNPAPGRGVSMFYALPVGVNLEADDLLRFEIRGEPARPGRWYRIQWITAAKEVFRYGEDRRLGNYWESLDCRIGDFSATFWSRAAADYRLPTEKMRFLRISVQGSRTGDALEIRSLGISRASSN